MSSKQNNDPDIITYVGLFFVGLNFEKTGAITTSTFRNLFNGIKLPRFGK